MSFDQKTREADRIYDEFEPPFDWDHEDTSDTLVLMLPGYFIYFFLMFFSYNSNIHNIAFNIN
jgi:hypothetical protein